MLCRAPSGFLSLSGSVRRQGRNTKPLAQGIGHEKTIDDERSAEHHRLSGTVSTLTPVINFSSIPSDLVGTLALLVNHIQLTLTHAPKGRLAPPLAGAILLGASPQAGGGQRQGGA